MGLWPNFNVNYRTNAEEGGPSRSSGNFFSFASSLKWSHLKIKEFDFISNEQVTSVVRLKSEFIHVAPKFETLEYIFLTFLYQLRKLKIFHFNNHRSRVPHVVTYAELIQQ